MANLTAPTETTIARRPAAESDRDFLFELYASTRLDETAALKWDPAQQESFLKMQFHARGEHYRREYPDACDLIVLLEDRPVGRMLTDQSADAITLVDIAILPPYRNQGIGTSLVESLTAQARRAGRPVRLHVQRPNHALRVYERLGFVPIAEDGLHVQMEWRV